MSENECNAFSEKMSGLLDGELSVREAEHVKRHIASCPECANEYREMETLTKHLKSENPPAVSNEKWAAAWKNIEGRMAARPRVRTYRWLFAGAAAAAVIVVALALFAVPSGEGPGVAALEQADMEIYEVGDGYRAYIAGSADGPNTIEIIVAPEAEGIK
jgi:anti-sigma factor RsiW